MSRFMSLGLATLLVGTLSASGVDFASRAFDCAPNQEIVVSGFQRFARLKNSDGDARVRYNPTAGALGYIYRQNNWEAGAAFSWEHGNSKLNGDGYSYKIRNDTPGVSLFGSMRLNDGWYVDGSGFVGFKTLKPRSLYTDAAGHLGRGDNQHKTVLALGMETGRIFDLGNAFRVTPHVGLDYAYTPPENYRFRAAGAPDYGTRSQNYFEIPLGVSFSKELYCGNWTFVPNVDVTMVNSIGRMDAMNTQPGFAYWTNKGWKVGGVGGDHIGARLSAGLDARVNDRTTFGIDYTYEGRKSYNDHRLSAMFGWAF